MSGPVHAFSTKTIHIGMESRKIASEARGKLDIFLNRLRAIRFFLR
jgi:hypothetical protein